jgi:hypothetical protein
LAIFCSAAAALPAAEIVVAENGRSDYRIVVADGASPSTRYAAAELQMFLAQISGARLPITSDREAPAAHEIVLGQGSRLQKLAPGLDFQRLGDEGYVIRSVGPHLVIAGGALRGNLYGVYGLLQDHLGCRWFAPGVSRIPKRGRVALGPLDETKVPVLEYREPYVFECLDGDWCARNRMNSGNARLEARHGGKVCFAKGFFVHTFCRLVPPEKYFAAHPEYFSLVGGKRQDEYAQLCCTNEDVIRLCTEAVRAAMRAQPDATVFSVSQNDTDKYCECPQCQALAQAEGTQAAPVLHLVNRVAEALEKEFPGKAVETLAYHWSRRAPRHLRPRPNVIVRLCSIECCFLHPLAACEGPANRAFCADLRDWSKAARRLWVWNYAVDFNHYLLPFPNQRVRGPNVRLFVANGVKGIFEQGAHGTPHSQLAALGGYLAAKLLWNPECDQRQARDEFLEAYYGRAAPPVRAYIDLLHDRAERENLHLSVHCAPQQTYFGGDFLPRADALWEEAEKLTAADPAARERVRCARMCVDYTILERLRAQRPPDALPAELAARRFEPFLETLAASGMTQLGEGRKLNVDDYRADLAKAILPAIRGAGRGQPGEEPAALPDREIRVGVVEGDIRGGDGQAIQQAIDRLADQGGGTVRVGPGRYVLRNSLQLRSKVRLIGTSRRISYGNWERTVLASCDGASARLARDAAAGDRQIVLADAGAFRVGDGVQIRDSHTQYAFTDRPVTLTEKIGENAFRLSAPLGQGYAVARNASVVRAFQMIAGYNVSRATAEGLVLDGNRAKAEAFASTGGTGAGIYLYACDHLTLRDCTLRNYRGDGISFQWGCHHVTIEDCVVENCVGHGLHPGSDSHDCIVRRNRSTRNLAPGLFVCVNVKHVLFERNELADNRGPGISIGCGDTDNLFRENRIVGNGRTGVLFRDDGQQGAHRNVLERNTILDNGLAEKGGPPRGCITILGVHHGLVFRENTLGNSRPGGPVGVGILGGHDPHDLAGEGNHFLNLEMETAPVAEAKPK